MLSRIKNFIIKCRLELFYKQIYINLKDSIYLFFSILSLAIIEMFIIGSLFPIIKLFQEKQKVIEFKNSIENLINYNFDLNFFIILLISGIITLFILSSVMQSLSFYFSSKVTENIFYSWKKEILQKYLNENIKFFSKNQSGDLIQRSLVHTREASSFIFEFFILCKDFIIALLIYFFLLYVSVKLTLFFSLIFLFILLISLYIAKNLVYKKASEVATLQEIIFSNLSNIFQSIKVIKAFQKEEYFLNKLEKKNKIFMKNQIINETLVKIPAIFNRTITFIIAMFFLLFAVLLNYDETIITSFLVFLAGMYKINNSLGSINNSLVGMARLLPNIEIVFNELNRKQIIDKKLTLLNSFKKNLVFKNINFKYLINKPIISNLEFMINKGEMISIVGPSGVGKSTLIDILCGHVKSEQISILLDNNELNLDKEKLSKNIFGYVSQDGYIFPGTIRENITFFSDQIKEDKISEAVNIAELNQYINTQEKGIDSILFEGGKNLSGGQKQRISIARMICSNFEILVLDESTSHLDQVSEENVINNLKKWIKKNNKSVVCITHSTSITKISDKIYVMNKGKFDSIGSHDHLINDKFYKDNFY